jgi:O-antigen/teichoic acid export membrane protein
MPLAPQWSAALPARRLWSATLWAVLARQWGALCTFMTLALLARTLTSEDFGRFTFYLAVLAFVDVLVDCGTSSAAVQSGARDPVAFAGALASGRRIRAVAALLAALLVSVAGGLAGERGLVWITLAALGALARVSEMSAVVFQRDIAWGRPFLMRALGATLRLLLIAALTHLPELGFGPYLLAHAGALALGNLAIHFFARPLLPPARPPLPGFFARAWPLALLGLVQQAYFYADNGFVRAFAGETELGHYNAAVRLFQWLAFFAAFATTSALPWLASRGGGRALGAAVGELAPPLFAFGCFACGVLWPWRAALLTLAFGPTFATAGASLGWLLAALLPIALGAAWLTALIAAGRSRTALTVALSALVINLLGNAWLVPTLGAEGAARMTLVTELAVALGAFLALHRNGARPHLRPARLGIGLVLGVVSLLGSKLLYGALAPALPTN